MAEHDPHHAPCETAVRLQGEVASIQRATQSLESAVFGNGRNALRQDIDMNTRQIEQLARTLEVRANNSWALYLVVLTALLNLASAALLSWAAL